ncbi:MAG: hypothetical protein M1378_04865 [Bacteroidetes bacterium]|jgi:dienelactone hydrolase|nr:hypothetical protein [Bacteroidota bacterium]
MKSEGEGMLKIIKWLVWAIAAIGLIVILCGVYLAERDYGSYFAGAKGRLVESKIAPVRADSVFRHEWLSLESDRGLKVECGLLIPAGQTKTDRYPVVILLGGKATGKHAIDYALDIRNVIIVAPDYPYAPRESYSMWEFLRDIPEMRRAALSMVPSVMLVTDYLWQRPDVDTTKLVLLGYSFGAPFVSCVAAYDGRASVVAMVFGGGDLHGLIRHNVRRYKGPVTSELVGILGGILLQPLEPLRYVDRIHPIPLVMINGTEDEQIPGEYTRRLFEKARQPKKLIWLDARHVNPRNVELTKRIVSTLKQELVEMRVLSAEN